jgi:hypothetical protein
MTGAETMAAHWGNQGERTHLLRMQMVVASILKMRLLLRIVEMPGLPLCPSIIIVREGRAIHR